MRALPASWLSRALFVSSSFQNSSAHQAHFKKQQRLACLKSLVVPEIVLPESEKQVEKRTQPQ